MRILIILGVSLFFTTNSFAWKLAKVEGISLVPSIVDKVDIITTKKSFHGKTLTRKTHKTVNKKTDNLGENEEFLAYTKRLSKQITNLFNTKLKKKNLAIKKSKKQKNLPLSKAIIKLQIQASGVIDLLYIGTANPIVEEFCNDVLASINKVERLPLGLEQGEIQVNIAVLLK